MHSASRNVGNYKQFLLAIRSAFELVRSRTTPVECCIHAHPLTYAHLHKSIRCSRHHFNATLDWVRKRASRHIAPSVGIFMWAAGAAVVIIADVLWCFCHCGGFKQVVLYSTFVFLIHHAFPPVFLLSYWRIFICAYAHRSHIAFNRCPGIFIYI